jgi:hypothetical protein
MANHECEPITDAEAARWQTRIAETISGAGLKPFDASGCDSGDPLDWTDEQVRHALASQQEEIDALRAIVDVVKEEIVASGSGHVDCGDVACVLCRLRRMIVDLPRVGDGLF